MDELTIVFLQRLFRLYGRRILAWGATILGIGLVLPYPSLTDETSLFALFSTWILLTWAGTDRQEGRMAALLVAGSSRRAWMASYLLSGPLFAALTAFLCLLPQGLRPSLGAALVSLGFGWIVTSIGMFCLLRAERPVEMIWVGGTILVLATITAEPFPTGPMAAWHPLALLKWGILRTLIASGHLPDALSPTLLHAAPPFQGVFAPLLLSLVAWRGALRALDRLEIQPRIRF